MDLNKKLAIVTGAGSGMGQAIAWALSKAGMTVCAVGRSAEKLAETARRSPVADSIHAVPLDITNRPSVAQSLRGLESAHGPAWLLVNNAGVNIRDRAVDVLKPEEFDSVLQTNLTGAFNMTHAVLPGMIAARDGMILTISSIAGLRPLPLGGAAYCASKFALHGYFGTLAREMAQHGIRSTILCPGEVATPILDARPVAVSAEARAAMLQPEDIAEAVLFVARLPKRAHVPELVMKPLVQDYG